MLKSSHTYIHMTYSCWWNFQTQIRLDTRIVNTKYGSMSPEVKQLLTGLLVLHCSVSSVLNTAKTLRFVCVCVFVLGSQVAIVTTEQWRWCKQAVSDEQNRLRSSQTINHHQRCCLLQEVREDVGEKGIYYIDSDRPCLSWRQWSKIRDFLSFLMLFLLQLFVLDLSATICIPHILRKLSLTFFLNRKSLHPAFFFFFFFVKILK